MFQSRVYWPYKRWVTSKMPLLAMILHNLRAPIIQFKFVVNFAVSADHGLTQMMHIFVSFGCLIGIKQKKQSRNFLLWVTQLLLVSFILHVSCNVGKLYDKPRVHACLKAHVQHSNKPFSSPTRWKKSDTKVNAASISWRIYNRPAELGCKSS